MVSLPVGFLSVITSLPPLIATVLALPPLMPRPLIRVVVVHFFFLPLVVHVLWLTIAERANFSPRGTPIVTAATFGPPLAWLILNVSFGCPLASPLVEPDAVGASAQPVNVIGEDTVL